MDSFALTIVNGEKSTVIGCRTGESILSAMQRAGFAGIHAPCGGQGRCGQCTVLLSGREVLACRTFPEEDCTVCVPVERGEVVVSSGAADIQPCGSGLGLAVDIGTTTVAAYLYDLKSGKYLGSEGESSAQRPYGADVISRITCCGRPGGLDGLAFSVRNQLGEMAKRLCTAAGRSVSEIERISAAGNTVMEHIFEGLSPVSIGSAPFEPISRFGYELPASGLINGIGKDAGVYLCPALAGYVGGDITAGLLSSGACRSKELCLFIDIGTNGEMALGDERGFVTCAAAAGPAFEGAEIDCGMPAADGAVNRVGIDGGKITVSVIGETEAAGVCGSGLIDAAAVLLQCGALLPSGRLLPPDEAPERVRDRLRRDENGRVRFYLAENVYVSDADVRKLQLAKAAIRAGVETLLAKRGVAVSEVGALYLAGGFGAYLDMRSACRLGMLPTELLGRTRVCGNTSGLGAVKALSQQGRADMEAFAAKCSYLEMSTSPEFGEKFMEYMFFGDE